MSRSRLVIITAAMMLSLFLASVEATVVATAMPTIAAQLGGLEIYAWVFSIYMLTATTMTPIFGKLSDIYGRRRIFLISITAFMLGSTLCAQAQSMPQLILFRALQGLGAGGIQPLAFTIIGDIFTFEQRAKVQGLFSGVWGVSSLIGPLVGGFLVEFVSWHWIFYLNVPFGLLAVGLMLLAWRDVQPRTGGQVDYAGALLMSGGIATFILALFELRAGRAINWVTFWVTMCVTIILWIALGFIERRVANPILPVALFRDRLFAAATGHGFFAGFALFGGTAFIPLFAQAVLGVSATVAGATLTPQLLSWTLASIIGTRLLLRYRYRSLALIGVTLLVLGEMFMTQVSAQTPVWFLTMITGLMGTGMGLSVPTFLIAVQSQVPRHSLGTATATVQFSRSIGGAVGTSVMGVILAMRLNALFAAGGLGDMTLEPLLESAAQVSATMVESLRGALTGAVQAVFSVALVAAACAWLVTALAPRGMVRANSPTTPKSPTENILAD